MKAKEFVEISKKIANEPTVYYSVAGGDWCKWNGSKWNMDCVCMIKGILWGFNFNKQANHGGAIYKSNGVYDDDANGIMKRCSSISNNFNNIKIGEIVHMEGHVGVYIGNRQVVESTAWYGKTIISNIGYNGERTKDGNNGGKWLNHGCLQYIDYSEDPTPSNKKYLNLNPDVNSWTVYNTNNSYVPNGYDVKAKLNPMKYNGLTYEILEDCDNYHFKIKTSMFGECYIAGNPYKYSCSITDKPIYKNGCY